MPNHHRLLTAALALALGACGSLGKRDDPPPRIETVALPVSKYVPVSPEVEQLLAPCPIAEGPRSQVFDVARQRKEALQACNGDKAATLQMLRKAAEQSRGK